MFIFDHEIVQQFDLRSKKRSGKMSKNNSTSKKERKQRFFAVIAMIIIIAMLASTLIAGLTGCGLQTASYTDYIDRTSFYFDTVINIRIYDQKDESILDGCMELAQKYDSLLSAQTQGSDIWNINHSSGTPVTVDPDTISLLNLSLYYADLTDGAFNPALGSVISLWDFTSDDEKSHTVPDNSAIEEALPHTDYHAITIDDSTNTVTLTDPDVQIDLGAIAKGFIADKIKEYLLSQNVSSAIINLGGNALLVGSKPDNTSFTVGIEKPFSSGDYITTISTSDKSIVTSGVYERYFELDGTIYHHLLDPATGFPVQNNLYSVTIVSDNSADGDALSTACFVLGSEAGMSLIESLDGIEAAFVYNDYSVVYSSGFPIN